VLHRALQDAAEQPQRPADSDLAGAGPDALRLPSRDAVDRQSPERDAAELRTDVVAVQARVPLPRLRGQVHGVRGNPRPGRELVEGLLPRVEVREGAETLAARDVVIRGAGVLPAAVRAGAVLAILPPSDAPDGLPVLPGDLLDAHVDIPGWGLASVAAMRLTPLVRGPGCWRSCGPT
jgi:hypothetical protein